MSPKLAVKLNSVAELQEESEGVTALIGELNGQTRTVARLFGLAHAGRQIRSTYLPLPRAQEALLRAIERLAAWPGAGSVPDYALDPELIALLVERMGFQAGGGPRALSAATILGLLVDPARLVAELETYAARLTSPLSESDAPGFESSLAALIDRVRKRASACANA